MKTGQHAIHEIENSLRLFGESRKEIVALYTIWIDANETESGGCRYSDVDVILLNRASPVICMQVLRKGK